MQNNRLQNEGDYLYNPDKSRFVDLIISHFYRVINNQIYIICNKPAPVIPVRAFFVYAQIDITEIIMLISEGIKIPSTISERNNDY